MKCGADLVDLRHWRKLPGQQSNWQETPSGPTTHGLGGLSSARLGCMHTVMAGYVQRGDVPGMVTLVSRRGEVHVDAIGTKAIGASDPIERDTIFRIASMTKPITAVAAMILVEECKVRLDEPVDRLLPELAARKVLKRLDGPLDDTVPTNRPITVRDLLTFCMGIGLALGPPDKYPILKAMQEQKVEIGPYLFNRARTGRLDPRPRHTALDVPAGRKVDVPHRVRRAGRADHARLGPAARKIPPRSHLRAAGHEGHRFQRSHDQAR